MLLDSQTSFEIIEQKDGDFGVTIGQASEQIYLSAEDIETIYKHLQEAKAKKNKE